MSYVVAVPSYNRYDSSDKAKATKGKHKGEVMNVGTMTLTMLKEGGVPTKDVYLFVANEEQKELYEEHIDRDLYGHIVVGVKGLLPQRNFINHYFPKGKHIVQFDDDVWKLSEVKEEDGKKVLKQIKDLDKFFKYAFDTCKKENAHLWGLAPSANEFYLSPDKVSVGIYFCPGWGWGQINRKLKLSLPSADGAFKEDYERTLQNLVLDEKVVRFSSVVADTEMYSIGGLDASRKKREEANIRNVAELVKRFPNLIKVNPKRKPVGSEAELARGKSAIKNYKERNPEVMKYITEVSADDFGEVGETAEEVEEEEEEQPKEEPKEAPKESKGKVVETDTDMSDCEKILKGSGFYPMRYMVWGRV